MSNDQPNSKRKHKFTIEPLNITKKDRDSVRNVMSRMFERGEKSVPPVVDYSPSSEDGRLLDTAVPQYRSTAVPQLISDEIKSGRQQNTGVPEYRSTGVPESPIPKERFYRKANDFSDHVDRTLTPAESKVFDQLYRLSVGFNQETCRVRVSVLMARTGYSSDKTVRMALRGLESKGRIRTISSNNSPLGDEYRILPYSGNAPYSGNTGVPEYRSTAVENTAVLESKITGELKTDLNTRNTNDDEAFAGLIDLLRQAAMEVTGNDSSLTEADRWTELGELLVTELRLGASRTTGVSSAPAFLIECLRRKLSRQPSAQPGTKAPDIAATVPVSRPEPPTDGELIEMFTGFLHQGMTLDDLDGQLSASIDPERWPGIRQAALERYEAEKGHIRPAEG